MAYKLAETERAQQDLRDIVDYIVSSLENPSAATTLLDEVEDCYDSLEQFPLMYETCRDPQLKALGYRKVCIRNYVIVYKVNEPAKTVFIMRFFYGKQDYEKLL